MSDALIHAASGSIGGGVAMALTYPLVNVSTRVAVSKAPKDQQRTTLQEVAHIVKHEGVKGLYSGLSTSLFGIALTNGVYTASYEEVRAALMRRRSSGGSHAVGALSTVEGIIAGMIAGSITTILTSPVWTIQAFQSTRGVSGTGSDGDKQPTFAESAQTIIKQDGIRGLWRGLGPALILVINPVIQYTTFERLVAAVLAYRAGRGQKVSGRSSLSDWDVFMLGALSKLVATGVTYPILVVKSRLQAATHKYKSSLEAILQIFKTEGLSGLYAGIGPKLLQSTLTAAFMFVTQRRIFELVKRTVVSLQQKRAVARA